MKPLRLASFALFLLATAVWAQSPTPAPSATAEPQSEASAKKTWALAELDQAKQREAAITPEKLEAELKATGLPETLAADFITASHESVRNYQASVDLLTSVINNQRTLADLQKQPALPQPKSEADVDSLRDKIAALRQQSQTADTQLQLDDAALAKARTALDAADQQFRRTSEESEAAGADAASRRRAALQLQGAELRQQAASSAAFLATWRVTLDELDQQSTALNLRRTEKALADSGLDTIFSKARADIALSRLTQTRDAVRKQLEDTRRISTGLNDTLATIEKNLEAATKAARKTDINALTVRQSIATEASNIATRITQASEGWLTSMGATEALWQSVLTAVAHPDAANYQLVRDRASEALADITPWRDQIPRYLQDTQRRIDELTAAPASKDAETRRLEEIRLSLLQSRAAQLRDLATAVENQYAIDGQMVEESRVELAARSLAERGQQAVKKAATGLRDLWHYELTTITDSNGVKRSITVAKVVIAMIGLLAGVALAKILSRGVSGRIQRRFSLEPARGAALEKAFFVPLLLLIVLTILNWLSIPLTTFAFLGGALAIGVGFGAQTLVNNFISGLILIAERRIRVGDIIEVDSQTGIVMNLGTRCSRISKGNGVEVLVPNSYFLEKNVANWTLSDPRHCYDFTIGMAYGTDPNVVIPVLLQAVTAETKVLADPAPNIFFESYGDSALVFHIYYWVNMRGTDNREIGSNIRLRIHRLCQDARIQIANPQRDIHLSTTQPLDLRLGPDNGKSA